MSNNKTNKSKNEVEEILKTFKPVVKEATTEDLERLDKEEDAVTLVNVGDDQDFQEFFAFMLRKEGHLNDTPTIYITTSKKMNEVFKFVTPFEEDSWKILLISLKDVTDIKKLAYSKLRDKTGFRWLSDVIDNRMV